jgi:arylsulfatase A-like enzyme
MSDETRPAESRPNIVFVFGDQWGAFATGYGGNPDVQTPNIDALAAESVVFSTAVSCCPVCTPYRANLLTGRFPLSHGLFLNDLRLPEDEVSIADVLEAEGYDTAYIGKWHLDGPERSAFTPPGRRRHGFDYWAVADCTHDYMHSIYYRGEDPTPRYWDGYDAHAQTDDAISYIESHGQQRPYCLFLSWGPPHFPWREVPQKYLDMYDGRRFGRTPNRWEVDERQLAGYYAHCTALDDDIGRLVEALDRTGQADDTIFVFTSDHGTMMGSHGLVTTLKQYPYAESALVPLVVRYPREQGEPRRMEAPLNEVDLMPTLLSMAGAPIPEGVQGQDLSHLVTGAPGDAPTSSLVMSVAPFNINYLAHMPAYRGIYTSRYAYMRSLQGPWLLFDNANDPYQMHNLALLPEHADLVQELDTQLQTWLDRTHDPFLTAEEHIAQWGYQVDHKHDMPYHM